MGITVVHLLAAFAAQAQAHGYTVHQSHGSLGWVLWTQPRHGVSSVLACIQGHIVTWNGRKS
jgi:hypothetical protein